MDAATNTTATETETTVVTDDMFADMFALSTDSSAVHAQEQAKLARTFARESRYSLKAGKHRGAKG